VISIIGDDLRQVRITDEGPPEQPHPGVEVVVSEPKHDLHSLRSEDTIQALAEMFAPYLMN
jgi:hypothetical protein